MTDNQAIKLTRIFLLISDLYDYELVNCCQRFTNNNKPEFTDSEIITIYIFAMIEEKRFTNLQIYNFAANYLSSWFPKLPSYTAFNTRLNLLASAFHKLSEILIITQTPENCDFNTSLLDSMPIITCSGKREAKVSTELVDKGYCSTKNLYYYGLKLHLLAFSRPNTIPFPESYVLTPASENDLNVFKQYWSNTNNRTFYGDKIYHDKPFFDELFLKYNSKMYTPIKNSKGMPECLKQRDKAFNDLYSKAVSKIRQPIESFFNWLLQKTDIQKASRVRSSKGLLVHVFGRIAVALFSFNS